MLKRRTPRKPFRGYTGGDGIQTEDAPKNWPFGQARAVYSKAQPKLRKKHEVVD